jgi:hypothetical protein
MEKQNFGVNIYATPGNIVHISHKHPGSVVKYAETICDLSYSPALKDQIKNDRLMPFLQDRR